MEKNNYILGFGLTYEHFRQFVEPLPGFKDEVKSEDLQGKLKYNGYFLENLYEINTPARASDFIQELFSTDYIYSLRREYRRERGYPDYETSSSQHYTDENVYVFEKLKIVPMREGTPTSEGTPMRAIPECLRHVSIGFIQGGEDDSETVFAIGVDIMSLWDWNRLSEELSKHLDEIKQFFAIEEPVSISIYKVI
jgi:hypothetical protein